MDRKQRIAEIKASMVVTGRQMVDYKTKNAIEFIEAPPNPGFNPKQAQVVEAFVDVALKIFGMSGGNRLGKTFLLTAIGISVVIGKFPWDDTSLLHLFPHKKPRKVRYIGQGWNDHIKSVVIPELYKLWPQSRIVERNGNGIITDTFWKDAKTGSTIEIMSNTQQPKVHEGWSGDLILYDEPPKREIYIANARGLVDRRGREMFAATLLDEPWVDREIVKKVDPVTGKPDKSIFWVDGSSYDNVGYGITEEGIDEFKVKLTDDEVQARIYGVPQYMQGLVEPEFNRKTHLFEHFTIPLHWMVDILIDIHPREKQACLFTATDERNDRYTCDEIWEHGDGTQIAEAIIRKISTNSYRVNRIAIDPLSKADSNQEETTFQKIAIVLMRHDYFLETASKDKDDGILEFKKHLKGPNNKPSWFLLDNCMRTLYEIEGYMWDKDTNKAIKKDDHMMENLYRTMLLKTEYISPEEEYYPHTESSTSDGRSATTGY